MNGQQLGKSFIERVVWPTLQRELGSASKRLAIAVIGTGSDAIGLDDERSRDHHWGPRANVMILPEDADSLLPRVYNVLDICIPRQFDGFPVSLEVKTMTGLCCCSIDGFFDYFLGTPQLPANDLDWLKLCEVDLFHVTSGIVVVDGPGELTRRRQALSYYPDLIWKKRIADWCMYITGRDAPYNVNRALMREDELTASMYKALYIRQVMELCFTLNRRYAPYTKWLYRTFSTLPNYVDRIAPMVDALYQDADLNRSIHRMIAINYLIGDAIADLGLALVPVRKEYHEGMTDVSLYDTAAQIYRDLPEELLPPSFNRTELWERFVRDSLCVTNDFYNRSAVNGG